jgi:uncharacterized repeat protein (TIGR03803 family)
MKKVLLLILSISLAGYIQSQPRLLGMTNTGSINGGGTIIQYKSGDTSVNTYFVFPSPGCPGCGAYPAGGLTEGLGGKFYGLSQNDGTNYVGTLFEYDYATDTEIVLVNFNFPTCGGLPQGSLLLASNGLYYGLTSNGGSNNFGTLFSYAVGSDSVISLVNMPVAIANSRYNSLIQSSNGKLYGMTSYDGTNNSGTIFEYDITANTYTVKYNLPTYASPLGDLLEVGRDTLYGLTYADSLHPFGTIFSFVPATSSYTILYSFDSIRGANPQSSLIKGLNGKLYGTASDGGLYGIGSIFSFDPVSRQYADIHDFDTTDGANPIGSLYLASDSSLYGMAYDGGTYSDGTIYRYNIKTATFSYEASFNYTNGSNPLGHLTEYILAPVLTNQPQAQAVCPGSQVRLSASGNGYTTAQWQYSTGTGSYINIPGATDTVYSFTASTSQNGYLYRILITNVAGTDTSAPATLTVLPADTVSQTLTITLGQQLIVGHDTLTSTGTYTDTLLDIHSCDSIVTTHLTVVDGINELAAQQFSLSPNPTNGSFTIKGDNTGTLSIQVINLLGENLKTFSMNGSQQAFDISDLAMGLYEVKISDGNQVMKVMKVVKE